MRKRARARYPERERISAKQAPARGASRLFLSDGLRREEWAVRSPSRKATKLPAPSGAHKAGPGAAPLF